MKKLLFSTLALLLTMTSFAQISTPSASPSAEISQAVGLNTITINYSRPSMKGRTIFAQDGLVPFGETWRTGANSATKITIEDDANIGNADLKAGSYAVLTVPMARQWKVMFYTYEASSWSSYTEKEPVATYMATTRATAASVESFTIGVNGLSDTGASIDIMWESTMVSIPFKTEVHEHVMSDIKRVMAGPSSNDYYRAATYLHASGTDTKMALDYIQKANAGEDQRYWMVRREALILADLNRKSEAIEAAKRSLALATEAGNMDYVRMNEASIAEWGK